MRIDFDLSTELDKMTYLHAQFERLDSDALEIIMGSMYGCQQVAFEVLKERGEMMPMPHLDEISDRTSTGPFLGHTLQAHIRTRRTR